MQDAEQLRKSFKRTIVTLVVALATVVSVTYAWYIFNANRHITDVKMAAGTGVTFLISDSYDGDYKTSAGLAFQGLLDPVSTDQIRVANGRGGFQRATGFSHNDADDGVPLLASIFAPARRSDYYLTSLYLTTNSLATDVYLSGIEFEDLDAANPISTALRVGLVVHAPGRDQVETAEYVWELTDAHNPEAAYNTASGREAAAAGADLVLDSSRSDGSVIEFSPLTSANFASYDEETGKVGVSPSSVKVCELPAAASGAEHGTPVRVDVYVWLEGCDPDCTNNLCDTNLASLVLRFAGVHE